MKRKGTCKLIDKKMLIEDSIKIKSYNVNKVNMKNHGNCGKLILNTNIYLSVVN